MLNKFCHNQSFFMNKFNNKLKKLTKFHLQSDSCPLSASKSKVVNDSKSVCIVGGGFAGLYTALKLESLDKNKEINITLIDKKDKFVFLPLLYELALGFASVSEVAPLYTNILTNSRIKFIQSNVDNIDFKSNVITATDKNNEIKNDYSYDYLVVSPGAQPRLDIIEGAKEHAIPFYLSENAYTLKTKIKSLLVSKDKLINIIVIGGGYSGVEIATNIAEYIGQDKGLVTLIDRNNRIMNNSPDFNRNVAEKCLENSGVNVLCNISVKKIYEDKVTIIDKLNSNIDTQEINLPSDIVIITSGTQPSQLITNLSKSLPIDENGRITLNKNLKVLNYHNVFAGGDCSRIDGVLLPSTAQVAMQQSNVIANNIYNEIKNDQLIDFNYLPLGEMLTLGFKDAAITGLGGLVEIDGPFAALARRVVYAARMPTPTQSINALFNAGLSTANNILLNISKNSK